MSQTSTLEIITGTTHASSASGPQPQGAMTKTPTIQRGINCLHCMLSWFFCFNTTPLSDDNNCFYAKISDEMTKVKVLAAKFPVVAIRRRFAILCSAWVVVNFSVPVLKSKLLLGSELWKWSLLVGLLACGYHLCSQGTKILAWLLFTKTASYKKEPHTEFYVRGTRRSLSWVLYSGWLLLTWLFYFRRRWGLKETPETEVVLHIGTWTFVTFSVGSVLWLFKTVVVLLWEADAVYSRFKHRILKARQDVYFLAQICIPQEDIWDKHYEGDEINEEMPKQGIALGQVAHFGDEEQDTTNNNLNNNNVRKHNKSNAKHILFRDEANMYDVKKMATFFVNYSNSPMKDYGTTDVLKDCRKIYDYRDERTLTEEDFKIFQLDDGEDKKLREWLDAHGPERNSCLKLDKAMVKAHKNCLEIGRTLKDAKEVVKVLDRVWTGLVLVIGIIAWLLLTDIASTKMLVLIASPFLAATFIFGDTCKNIFEGIIFSFVNHPFDVGDRCIVDKIELEVKRMSVFSTTFIGIETNEEVLYPNTALASMPITNLKGEPDPHDQVELLLGSSYTGSMLGELKKKIARYLELEKDKYEKEHNVVMKDMGDNCITMAIEFKHVMRTDETTHTQCLQKKRKQRSEFLFKMKDIIDEINRNKT